MKNINETIKPSVREGYYHKTLDGQFLKGVNKQLSAYFTPFDALQKATLMTGSLDEAYALVKEWEDKGKAGIARGKKLDKFADDFLYDPTTTAEDDNQKLLAAYIRKELGFSEGISLVEYSELIDSKYQAFLVQPSIYQEEVKVEFTRLGTDATIKMKNVIGIPDFVIQDKEGNVTIYDWKCYYSDLERAFDKSKLGFPESKLNKCKAAVIVYAYLLGVPVDNVKLKIVNVTDKVEEYCF